MLCLARVERRIIEREGIDHAPLQKVLDALFSFPVHPDPRVDELASAIDE